MKLTKHCMQKYFYALMILPMFWVGAGCVSAQNDNKESADANQVVNFGFEESATNWKIPADSAEVVDNISHSGKHSLHYVNTDAGKYRLFTQSFKVQPGQNLHFAVWVKGKDVTARVGSEGAGIYLQGYDANGKYIKGSFPRTFIGTFDWTRAEGEYLVPADVVRAEVGLYLRQKATGEVWFDDVDVRVEKPKEFTSFLRFPNYRGIVKEHDSTPWQMSLDVHAQPEWKQGNIHIVTSLIDAAGKVLLAQNDSVPSSQKEFTFTFKRPAHLSLGKYMLKQQVTNPNGQVTFTKEFPIHVVAEMPKVYIDSQGFTVVDGKRFFPLGIYTGSHGAPRDGTPGGYRINSREIDLKRMSEAGLNTVLSYSYAVGPNVNGVEFLDLAEQNHLHVIYSVKDMYDGHSGYPQKGISGEAAAKRSIEMLKNHPALLAWYINDEMADSWLNSIQARYNQIVKSDNNHPAYALSNKPSFNDRYYWMTDVLGMDPYPAGYPGKKITLVSEWTEEAIRAAHHTKGIWQVLQLHNPKHHKSTFPDHPPTLAEMRNMSYQALIHGTKGLIYYAYHWLFFDMDKDGKRIYSQAAFDKRWPDVQKLIHEIKPLTDVILKDDKVALKVLSPSSVQYQAWRDDSKLYIMVVNTAEDKPESLKLQIPDGWHLADQQIPGIQAQLNDTILQLDLTPLASGTIILSR